VLTNASPRSETHIVPDDGVGSYRDVGTQDTPPADTRSRIDPWSRRLIREQCVDNPDECVIGICNDDSGARATGPAREIFRNQNGTGAGAPEVSGVPTGGREGESIGTGAVERTDRLNLHAPIAKQAATDQIGDRLRGETGVCHAPSCLL
jgi:hypothetical protein